MKEKIKLSDLEKALKESWCKETCYAPDENKWNQDNPAFGQCAVTSVIVYDYFGGKICYCKHQKHYWNVIDNKEIDLTRSQFPEGTEICCDEIRDRNYILFNEKAKKAKTFERYVLLKTKIEEKLGQKGLKS